LLEIFIFILILSAKKKNFSNFYCSCTVLCIIVFNFLILGKKKQLYLLPGNRIQLNFPLPHLPLPTLTFPLTRPSRLSPPPPTGTKKDCQSTVDLLKGKVNLWEQDLVFRSSIIVLMQFYL
jgi:hypothetical protein